MAAVAPATTAPRAVADSAAAPTSSAAAFRDSVGVVVHVSYFDTPYDQWDRVIAKLRELGVGRVRDGLFVSSNPDWNTTVYERLNAAALNGLRFDLVVPIGCSYQGTVDPCLSALKTRLAVNAVDSLEWPNEHDASGDPNWAASLTDWGRELFFRVKVDPVLGSIDVVGPSLVHPASRAQLGDQSDALDFGNVASQRPGRPARGSSSGRPVMALLDLLGRRWTLRVLWELREPAGSFRDLQARCDGMSSSVLAQRLRELREAGVVARGAGPGYALSDEGIRLLEALAPLDAWSRRWARRT